MQVLLCLLENPGKTVTKEHLHERVWQDVIITDHSINRAISQLRKVFGDDTRDPRVIETIPKIGYRILCPVEAVYDEGEPAVEIPETPVASRGNTRKVGALAAILLMLALVLWQRNSMPGEKPAQAAEKRIVPLTTEIGHERFLSFGPRDSSFVYVHKDREGNQWDIFLNRPGRDPEKLTDTADRESHLRFSPISNEIAFIENNPERVRIVLLNLDSRQTRSVFELTKIGEFQQGVGGLDWSPDGAQIVFAARLSDKETMGLFFLDIASGLYTPVFATAQEHVWERFPAFSDDGRYLAFTRLNDRGTEQIYYLDMAGGETHRITGSDEEIRGLDWDKQHPGSLVYCSEINGAYFLKKTDLSGNSEVLLNPFGNGSVGINPQFNRDGTVLTFEILTYSTNIYRTAMDSGRADWGQLSPVVASSFRDWQPQISPDGSRIVFLSNRSGENRVWIADANGSNPKMVSDLGTMSTCSATWCPQSRYVYFPGKTQKEEGYHLYEVDSRSGSSRVVEENAFAPHFSVDGRWLYFSRTIEGQWEIWKKSTEDGRVEKVTRQRGFSAREGRDGGSLYINKLAQPGIWQINADGGEVQLLDNPGTQENFNWTVGRAGIYFISFSGNTMPRIAFYDFRRHRENLVDNPAINNLHLMNGLDLSPDDHYLYFTVMEHSESNIVKINWM